MTVNVIEVPGYDVVAHMKEVDDDWRYSLYTTGCETPFAAGEFTVPGTIDAETAAKIALILNEY